ncbi:MAG TPA: bifunctional phosphopantothenoylcysteine decarboxylase/phosphopantothenate--cysteine ligase CoaBC [Nitrospirales bacterium]|nr:bifunctional phosphopantothenoylcysteine decarboxylase/phosphopantothenate--cysteine ligase CoaBC [Nitrospirales bacterium]
MGRLDGKVIVLAVTGSIAAYKAVSLCRRLIEEGAEVRVVMTEAATRFVTPLTFEVLSKRPVATDLFAAREEMVHLSWADAASAIVIAPATANALARAAIGLADDLLGTLLLAARCPILIAPAMDGGMWEHAAVQQHVATLRARGVMVIDPEVGPLASGQEGRGRLADERTILAAVQARLLAKPDLAGQRVLISAGPTQEAIDAVRFISNRSSGKMGHALAEAARDRGASVVLVSGPTALQPPAGVELVPVVTAESMAQALASRLQWSTIVIMAAAVADFRPAQPVAGKIKKAAHGSVEPLTLQPTADILMSLSAQRTTQILVGFAAETQNPLSEAKAKLSRKGVDLVVGNNVAAAGSGFGSDTSAAVIVDRTGMVIEVPTVSKRELADRILDRVLALRPTVVPC